MVGDSSSVVAGVSIQQYRELLKDYESSDEQIVSRLKFIESLCIKIANMHIKVTEQYLYRVTRNRELYNNSY